MKPPRPAAAAIADRGRSTSVPRTAPADQDAGADRPGLRTEERPASAQRRYREAKNLAALARHQQKKEAQVMNANQELDAMTTASVRKVVLHALRHGVSARVNSGEPHPTAVGEGAMLIAQALHRDGVQATELTSLCELWQTPIRAPALMVAAEQLLGPGFDRLPYDRGTPLAELCEVLFGSAREVGDLVAAGAVVSSVRRKLERIESTGPQAPTPGARRPFVRKYTARVDGNTPR